MLVGGWCCNVVIYRFTGGDGWSGVDWAEKLDVNAIAIVRFVAPNFSLLRISPSAFGSIARAT